MVHQPCFTGFRGARRDANKLVPDVEHPPLDPEMDESGDNDPCPVDENFFHARPDAATMEEVIGKFMDGFKDLHQFVGRLPALVCAKCTETGQLSSRGLFLSRAAVRRHIAASKPCRAAKLGIREIQVDVRTSDVMAGAGGGAGPAPDVRHQPEGTVCRECLA